MTYWLDLFTPYTWGRFQDHGANTSGFRPRQRKTAFGRVKQGDKFLCYLVKLSRWCGVLNVSSDAFEDATPIFADKNDPFPIRFKVAPDILLDFEHSIPIEVPELWNKLSFTKHLIVGSFGWAQSAGLRQSLFEISTTDGELICRTLQGQNIAKKRHELDAADRRQIAQRMVVRTETGEIEVEVP
jgi:EVE domain